MFKSTRNSSKNASPPTLYGTTQVSSSQVNDIMKTKKFIVENMYTNQLFSEVSPVTVSTSGNEVYTTQNIISGIINRDPNGGNRQDSFPTASGIVGSLSSPVVDTFFILLINNLSSTYSLEVVGNTGVNLENNILVGPDKSVSLIILLSNISSGSEQVTVYCTSSSGIGGPSSTLNNSIVRWDGTNGFSVKSSSVVISDSGVISNVGNPVVDNDATSKQYVDNLVSLGLKFTSPVNTVTDVQLVGLSGLGTVDGVVLQAGDRVLVKNGTNTNPNNINGESVDNGIYVVSSGSWSRSTDALVGTTATGIALQSSYGTLYAGDLFVCYTVGTFGTAISFIRIASIGNIDGPSVSTDQCIVRWDGNSGNLVQDSLVTVSDLGDVSANSVQLKTSISLEDPGVGTNTVTLQAPSGLGSNYGLTLPSGLPQGDSDLVISSSGTTSLKRNTSAVTGPSVSDDTSLGYKLGSLWVDGSNKNAYICVNNSSGTAEWTKIVNSPSTSTDNAIIRWDGTSGNSLQNSLVTVSDLGDVSANSVQLKTSISLEDPGVGTNTVTLQAPSGLGSNYGLTLPSGLPQGDSDLVVSNTGGTSFKRNTNAIASPSVSDDSSLGYVGGSTWINGTTKTAYMCVDNSPGAAQWDIINNQISTEYLNGYISSLSVTTGIIPIVFNMSGNIVHPTSASFTLEGGKTYKITFNPRIQDLYVGEITQFKIRETTSPFSDLTGNSAVCYGNKRIRGTGLMNSLTGVGTSEQYVTLNSYQTSPALGMTTGNTNIWTSPYAGYYRITYTLFIDNQNGSGGTASRILFNGMQWGELVTQASPTSENDREVHTQTTIIYAPSAGLSLQIGVRHTIAGSFYTDIVSSSVFTVEDIFENTSNGGSMLDVIVSPVSTKTYEVYKSSLNAFTLSEASLTIVRL